MDYQPFTSSSTTDQPVALINPQAPLPDLLTYAGLRIRAARDMLDSVSSMTSRHADDIDLRRFSSVATLLLQDGCDVLHVAEQQAMQLPEQ
ncbi:hypothetical protein QL104_19025 [Pseudomonas piscis]|uniref:Short-chain dehydrogenase n=1 Tax=Pseudomonas piscis TaxID=2614538 RepID=A0ABY9NAT4_9PSED|nr:hypothetical protein [Pseudomonas piscis]WMN15456.1 hypothetical protein QL104_19025 [Pseudomonas piscis]